MSRPDMTYQGFPISRWTIFFVLDALYKGRNLKSGDSDHLDVCKKLMSAGF